MPHHPNEISGYEPVQRDPVVVHGAHGTLYVRFVPGPLEWRTIIKEVQARFPGVSLQGLVLGVRKDTEPLSVFYLAPQVNAGKLFLPGRSQALSEVFLAVEVFAEEERSTPEYALVDPDTFPFGDWISMISDNE